MAWLKRCSGCGKKIDYTATCDCMIKAKKLRYKEKNERAREDKKFFNDSRWKKLKEKIKERDGKVCLRCMIKYNIITKTTLEVHHIKPRNKYNGTNGYPDLRYDESNLITLCKSCNTQLGTKGELDFPLDLPNGNERDFVL